MSCTSLSVSMSNLPALLYLSVACCGSSVHHKTRYSLYIYLQHSTTYIHSVPRTRLFSPIARTHPPHFFPAASARVVFWPIDARVAEVGRKPRLTSWMASSQTDAISIHFPLHFPHKQPTWKQFAMWHCSYRDYTVFVKHAQSEHTLIPELLHHAMLHLRESLSGLLSV